MSDAAAKVERTVNLYPPSRTAGLRPWAKGQSGNPSGHHGEYHEVRRLCADHSLEAAEKQIRLMRESTDDRVIFMVTEAIMNRVVGKPRDHSSEQTNRVNLSLLTPEKREALAA